MWYTSISSVIIYQSICIWIGTTVILGVQESVALRTREHRSMEDISNHSTIYLLHPFVRSKMRHKIYFDVWIQIFPSPGTVAIALSNSRGCPTINLQCIKSHRWKECLDPYIFLRMSHLWEMGTASFRVWNRLTISIFKNDNSYATQENKRNLERKRNKEERERIDIEKREDWSIECYNDRERERERKREKG